MRRFFRFLESDLAFLLVFLLLQHFSLALLPAEGEKTAVGDTAAVSPTADESETPGDTRLLASYAVKGGILVPESPAAVSAKQRKLHQDLWNALVAFVPGSLAVQVSRLELFATARDDAAAASKHGADTEDGSAGASDAVTDGYAKLSEDGRSFILGLDAESARAAFIDRDPETLKDFEATIIHEFGHILSMGPSQMAGEGEKGGLDIDEGRLRSDSFLGVFWATFWKSQFPGRSAETLSDAEGTALFGKHSGSFVTEYAATGPLEDFAESFAAFVMGDKPSGNSIKDRKLQYFFSKPGLSGIRDEFRRGLAGFAGR